MQKIGLEIDPKFEKREVRNLWQGVNADKCRKSMWLAYVTDSSQTLYSRGK